MEDVLLERARIEGILIGLKICKELWAQGQISHEAIYENIKYYEEVLEEVPNAHS